MKHFARRLIRQLFRPRLLAGNGPELLEPKGSYGLFLKLITYENSMPWALLPNPVGKIVDPIFIVGAPRSGTTFLGDCFSKLDSVAYFFEPAYTKALGYQVARHRLSPELARRRFRSAYARLLGPKNAGRRFCEKTPSNVFIMPFLAETFATARFVHIIRDGFDVAVSHAEKGWLNNRCSQREPYEIGGYKNGAVPQFWVEPQRRDEFRATTDLHRSIWAWRAYVERGRRDGAELGPDRYMEIRYEDIVLNRTGVTRRISEFLNFDAEDTRRLEKAFRSGRKNSIGRGHKTIDASDAKLLLYEADGLMKALGYAPELAPATAPAESA